MPNPIPNKSIPHGTKTGYSSYRCRCDECRAANAIYVKQYRARNGERMLARQREWEARNVDRLRLQRRTRYEARRDHVEEQRRRWRVANSARVSAVRLAWQESNRDLLSAQYHRRRARSVDAGTFLITTRDWRRLCIRFDHRCAYCGNQRKLTREHVVPLSRGGRDSIGNLLPVCLSCNSSKQSKLLVEWRYERLREVAI